MTISFCRLIEVFFLLACICILPQMSLALPTTELLWPDGAPGAKGDKPADKPTLTIYLPDAAKANGGGPW